MPEPSEYEHSHSEPETCDMTWKSVKLESIKGFPEAMERFLLRLSVRSISYCNLFLRVILQYYHNLKDVNCSVICDSEKWK